MRIYNKLFERIIEPENLFSAWDKFRKGKNEKLDVLRFEKNLEQNIFQLHRDLRDKTYKHGGYTSFYIHDPKPRHIHKATVRDRVLHHAVFKVLNPVFEPIYIHNSFSCRLGKGNHKGVKTLAHMLRQASRNNTKTCFVLKCDIRKFFDSIDHDILIDLVQRKIRDKNAMNLLREILSSFANEQPNLFGIKGVPIGNLTSQLFANIYMNGLDQFMRHDLKVKYYARYTDDFVIVSDDENYLKKLLPPIQLFLKEKLKLGLHPSKVSIRKYRQGIDFLGYVALPHHVALRTKTKKRMMWKLRNKMAEYKNNTISKSTLLASFQSYLGVLSHADSHKLTEGLQNKFWFWLGE
jgi:retron-type reverse transcriptase